jgi:hypothetical protein
LGTATEYVEGPAEREMVVDEGESGVFTREEIW